MDSTGSLKKGAGADETMIRAQDVVVNFGPIVALNRFSASIPRGIVGLLGPNGAGKSTFIKTLLGLVKPVSGALSVAGLDPRVETTAVRDMIGYMPEHGCLIENMNSVEMVAYMGRISGMSRMDAMQRTHEVLDFVGVNEERYRPIDSYSTGMKQRVKLAQAIVHDPNFLFLDEPTNGMDPQGRDEMLELITKIGDSGKTLLVSTHVLHELEKIGNHVIIIHQGAMIKNGPMEEIIGGDEDRYSITVRGTKECIASFRSALEKNHVLESLVDESGQMSFKISGLKDTGIIFSTASTSSIQVRSISPDMLSLEDVFLDTFKGGGKDGA